MLLYSPILYYFLILVLYTSMFTLYTYLYLFLSLCCCNNQTSPLAINKHLSYLIISYLKIYFCTERGLWILSTYTGSTLGKDLLMTSMKRRTDYRKPNQFHCIYGHPAVVLRLEKLWSYPLKAKSQHKNIETCHYLTAYRQRYMNQLAAQWFGLFNFLLNHLLTIESMVSQILHSKGPMCRLL